MRLLYVLTSYPPSTGGAQIHHHRLAQEMTARGHQVQALGLWDNNRTDWLLGTTIRAPGATREYVVDGISVRLLGLSRLDKLRVAASVATYYPLMPQAIRVIAGLYEPGLQQEAMAADLIHNVRIGREPLSFAALAAARAQEIPFVLTPVHHPRWRGWRYRSYRRLYAEADAVLALTPSEAQMLADLGVDPEKITVTGIGPVLADSASPERFRQRHGLDGPIVLFVGQHYRYKGYEAILEAAPIVWRSVPETQFVFIGPGVGDSDRVFARFTDKRIYQLGSVNLQEKSDAFAASDVFCMPSTQESFGGVYTEAWSFRKPVIGAPIQAVADIIEDGIDGYLVEPSAADLAERLTVLLLDPALRDHLGAAGYEKVRTRYDWRVIAEITERAYVEAIKRVRG